MAVFTLTAIINGPDGEVEFEDMYESLRALAERIEDEIRQSADASVLVFTVTKHG